jgi:hypothetical protein
VMGDGAGNGAGAAKKPVTTAARVK